MEQELVVIGSIAKAHGLRGEVQVIPETDFPERFASRLDVYLVSRRGLVRQARLMDCRRAGERILISIEGVDSREGAEDLAGWTICVARENLVELAPGQHYIFEIIGLRVEALDGRQLGTIVDVWQGPANDVYVARGPCGEILIPGTEEIVREIDVKAGVMKIVAMPGLIEEEGQPA